MTVKVPNALSPTGKVHAVIRKGNSHYLSCNSWFNLAVEGYPDWKQTYKEVTCRRCLKLCKELNKVWKVIYYTDVSKDLYPAGPTKTKYLVAPNKTEAALLFGHYMPEDCAHSRIEVVQVSMDELLKEKRML